jgi:thioredoxin-related protein
MKRAWTGLLSLGAAIVVAASIFAGQAVPEQSIKWLTFEEAVRKNEKEPRLLLIDVYTDWCGWCKKMDRTTYSDADVAAYINKNYWPVRFNAEQRDSILFSGKTFRYVPERKAHELALSLLSEKMSYPSTVFLNKDLSMIQALPGYLDATKMAPIIAFFIEGQAGSTKSWPEYEKSFKGLPKHSSN